MQELVERKPPFLAVFDGEAYRNGMTEKARQVGLLGGTFNPVHHGHLILARWAGETLGLDEVWLIPNRRSPLRMGEPLAPAEERLSWVEASVRNEPTLSVCDLEVKREGTSYLVDTLEELCTLHPDTAFTFIMGADSLTTFDHWVKAERILELVEVRVVPRPGEEAGPALASLEEKLPPARGKVTLLPESPHLDISATEVRNRVKEGLSIRYYVAEEVAERIEQGGFFRK